MNSRYVNVCGALGRIRRVLAALTTLRDSGCQEELAWNGLSWIEIRVGPKKELIGSSLRAYGMYPGQLAAWSDGQDLQWLPRVRGMALRATWRGDTWLEL